MQRPAAVWNAVLLQMQARSVLRTTRSASTIKSHKGAFDLHCGAITSAQRGLRAVKHAGGDSRGITWVGSRRSTSSAASSSTTSVGRGSSASSVLSVDKGSGSEDGNSELEHDDSDEDEDDYRTGKSCGGVEDAVLVYRRRSTFYNKMSRLSNSARLYGASNNCGTRTRSPMTERIEVSVNPKALQSLIDRRPFG